MTHQLQCQNYAEHLSQNWPICENFNVFITHSLTFSRLMTYIYVVPHR
jgi:hypothetical protein